MPPSCPSESDLLHALRSPPDRAILAHVASCDGCTSVVRELGDVAATLKRPTSARAAAETHLDDMTVAEIVERGSTRAQLEHLAGCAECRAHVAHVVSATSAADVSAEIARLERGSGGQWRRRFVGIAAAAAAIAVTVLLARKPVSDPAVESTVYRDAAPVTPAAPVVIAPVDVVTGRPVELRWRVTPDASQYRVTVFDGEGSIIWEGQTGDTAVAVPTTASFTDGTTYWWRVEARVGFDRWVPSELTAFSVGRPATANPVDGAVR